MNELDSLIGHHRDDHVEKEAMGLLFFSRESSLVFIYLIPQRMECHKNTRNNTNTIQIQNQDQGK